VPLYNVRFALGGNVLQQLAEMSACFKGGN
jgi:hypothetical protein